MKLIIVLSLLLYTMVMCQDDTVETVETIIEYLEEMEAETGTSIESDESVQSSNDSVSDESVEGTTNIPTFKPIEGPYKMGNFITCLEQNDEEPYGFKEKFTYSNLGSDQCAATPELCARYIDCDYDPEFCNSGDVCDHEDPLVYDENGDRLVRDCCKFAVTFLSEVDEEKSWSWKCARHEICPIKDEDDFYYDRSGAIVNGVGMMGCLVNDKRVICCCQYDYCTKEDIYAKYAAFGRADHWPTDFQALANIDPGEVYVVYDLPEDVVIPDWECIHAGNCSLPTTTTPTTTGPTETVTVTESDDEVDWLFSSTEQPDEELFLSSTSTELESEIETEASETFDTSTVEETENEVGEIYGSKSMGLNAMGYDYVISSGGQNEGVRVEDVLLICLLFVIGTIFLGLGVFIGTKWKKHQYEAAMDIQNERHVDEI